MKKSVFLFLAIFVLFGSNAFALENEITFNSIPWLSSDEVVADLLIEKGFARSKFEFSHENEFPVYFIENELLGYQPTVDPHYNKVSFATVTEGYGRIGGYPVENLLLSFAYDGSYQLISVEVNLIGADYESIREKLRIVYGEAEIFSIDEETISANLWRGKNSSAVMLYTESGGYDYSLVYGRLDSVEILSKCIGEADMSDVYGL